MTRSKERPSSSDGLSERRIIKALRAAFPGSKLGRLPKIERGMFYLSKERREVLEQVRPIAREGGRSEDRARALLSAAGRMAAEQFLAGNGAGGARSR